MNKAPRPQDPLYAGPRQGQRGGQFEARSPQPTNGPIQRPNGRVPEAADVNLNSRAARFEDEKRRIIESCFAKRDDDGIQVESYITHVKVTEDAAYPTAPAPPDAESSNKKQRVILVAVRKSGRVRVHKARENPSGTFSIGKTWNLDELSGIQSYSNLVPQSNQEEQEKQWAGGIGFVITLGKPYYWQAPTAKEKDFFIASLVKIYRKYTAGKTPELYGFSSQEMEALTGAPSAQATPILPNQASPQPSAVASPPPIPPTSDRRPQSPFAARNQDYDKNQDQLSQTQSRSRNDSGLPPRDLQRATPPIEPLRSPARNQRNRAEQNQRSSEDSTSQLPVLDQIPLQPPLFGSRPSPSPQSSQISLPANGRAAAGYLNGLPPRPNMSFGDSARNTPSLQSTSSRPSTAISEQKIAEQRNPSDEPLPERFRPSVAKDDSRPDSKSGLQSAEESQFATPAATPSDLRRGVHDLTTVARDQTPDIQTITKSQDYFGQNGISESTKSVKVSEPNTPASDAEILSPSSAVDSPTKKDEEYRPGLGPMIKKKSAKDIAGQFRKAALAASAFQPRQGGGAARLRALQDKDKASGEPDGITGVVPAPLFRGLSDQTKSPSTPTQPQTPETPPAAITNDPVPIVQVQRSATQETLETPVPENQVVHEQPKHSARSVSPDKARSRSPQRRKRQRQEAELAKYCSSLGIDPRVLDNRGAEFNELLTEFGWEGKLVVYAKIDTFETNIKREIGRAQATGWLGHVEQQEGKVQDLARAFDKAIEECEELDGLFTLYSHELETLAADIEYIEAQSQGLQVQTANQKLLQTELQNLLQTLTIAPSDLRGLKSGSLDSPGNVEKMERSLTLLYKALVTIDPGISQNQTRQGSGKTPGRSGVGVYADTEIGQMRAVRERKDTYREEMMAFVRRFNQHMLFMFQQMEQRNSEERSKYNTASATTLDSSMYHRSRQELWTYNAIMLFVREVNRYEWKTLINSYEAKTKGMYQDQFRNFAMSRRRLVHKPNGEELEALFTTQEKEKAEDHSLASTAARKLTVRRGKTVKPGVAKQTLGKDRDGKPDAWEVFDGVVQQQTKVIAEEQNFIVQYFHINSQANLEFAEIVAASRPDQRAVPNLAIKQTYDPDRDMATIVQDATESIYSFWLADLQSLLDWVLNIDQLQGVGVLVALEQCLTVYEETNQEYVTRTLRAVHERLSGLFHKFVDDQIKAVEETKVKVKKRKGVISFMRTFPAFSSTVENMIPTDMPVHDALEVRFIVNDAYTKILKAMWESLTFIAKDDPGTGGAVHSTAPNSGDPEDKEALNYHILLIENMSHYIEEVDTHRNIVLEEWQDRARSDMATHMRQYVDAVIRRPLGKWLDFLESTEAMMKTADSQGIAGKPSHSRSAAKKVLSAHDAKEIRKGIDTLKKRIEKHFGDVDDPSITSKSLILLVFDECNHRYAGAWERMKLIIDKVYDGNLELDWRKEEVAAMFKQR